MKTSSISRRIAVRTCRRPTGQAGEPGRVTSTRPRRAGCRARPAAELRLARLERGLDRLARLVGGAADGAALLRRELGDAAQQVRQLGLAAEEGDAHLLERGRPVAAAIAASPSGCSSVIRSVIRAPSYPPSCPASPSPPPPPPPPPPLVRGRWSPPWPRSGTPGRSGCARWLAGGDHALRQAFALGPDHERHLASATLLSGRRSAATAPPCGPAGRRRCSPARRGRRRSSHRGAHRLVAVRVRGARPSTTLPAPKASAERSTVPTLPGSRRPAARSRRGRRRGRPARRVVPICAGPRAELGVLLQQLRGDLLPLQP